jgi:hemerythrin-like domain-containing protein
LLFTDRGRRGPTLSPVERVKEFAIEATLLDDLEAQHREAEDLLCRLGDCDDPDEQQTISQELVEALHQHMEIEETEVYPRLRQLDETMAEEVGTEHELARAGLEQLVSLVGQPGFGAAVAMVQAGIAHHVKEEENEAFPELRRAIDTGQFESSLPTNANGGAGDQTRSELYELAKDRQVEGRSTITKDELRDAVER